MTFHYIDVVTDLGEECDDEVACLMLYDRCARDKNLFARIFFTNPAGRSLFIQLLEERLILPNCKLLQFRKSTFKSNTGPDPTLLLQIGPIASKHLGTCKEYTTKPFHYILLGEKGKTLNSNGDALSVATLFSTRATRVLIVATRGGAGAPKFTMSSLKFLGGKDSEIVKHVVKIGFRNSVGRACVNGGNYVAHLVAAHEKGANYQTVKSIAEHLNAESCKQSNQYIKPTEWKCFNTPSLELHVEPYNLSQQDSDAWHCFESYRQRSIMRVVDKYITGLVDNGLVEDKDGLIGPKKVTLAEIKEGYAFILDVLHQEFGIPIDLFCSQSPSREWLTTWDFQKDSPEFEETYSGISDTHTDMLLAYDRWRHCLSLSPHMELTPAYDCIAMLAAFDFFKGTLHEHFETDIGSGEILLQKSVLDKGLEVLLKASYV